jgi:signal transduction histidine kinase
LQLINDILDLSKVEAGRMEVEKIRCSPRKLVAEVVSLLRVKAQEKGLVLDYEQLGKVPEMIISDPARVKQLLMNLVGNAIKFTADGSVRIVTAIDLTLLIPASVFPPRNWTSFSIRSCRQITR